MPARFHSGATRLGLVWVLLFCLSLLAAGCGHQVTATALRPTDASGVAPARVHALLINGGGTREQNYQSHLLHVQHLAGMLRTAGVPESRITILSSDGQDPAADLATRLGTRQKGFWRLEGTRVESFLRPPTEFVNSTVDGIPLRPATTDSLRQWFESEGKRLTAGDVLFLYVTDHGTRDPNNSGNTNIVLWGREAKLPVTELATMLSSLDPQVRVVTLMSQCYSGGFAHLIYGTAGGAEPGGNVCGYFSSTADRPAYGCYSENRGRNNVGHSFHFLRGLSATRSFPAAHRATLVEDATPDVPLRSSDEYLTDLLEKASGGKAEATAGMVDSLLRDAWNDKARWEPEIRLLDGIAAHYGIFSPRTLAEIEAQARQLPDISDQMKNTSRAWRSALADANEANLERFLAARPEWAERVSPEKLKDIDAASRDSLTAQLVGDLVPFTGIDAATHERIDLLRRNGRRAAAASYRMEVRLGVLLRMGRILRSVAGRQYLATRGTVEQKASYDALTRCEDLSLPFRKDEALGVQQVRSFPPYEQDVDRAQAALPAWMGIQFREPRPEAVKQNNLTPGAAQIITIYPESPAEAAGLEQGDILLGPPGSPFVERGQVRSWVMLSKVGEPRTLDVLRGTRTMTITLVPRPFPLKWPELPGPPKVGSSAPALEVTPYRGKVPQLLAARKPRLLMFWATWCGPCKASVPEVLAFERQKKIPVLAITDEPRERLDEFFASFKSEFPESVAIDDVRKTLVAYGVSGTPTFVLIDEKGSVRSVVTGYQAEKGLPFEGWHWKH